jgi:flagellar basal-body rod modification protein FlgD
MSVSDSTGGLSLNDILANSSVTTNTSTGGLAAAAGAGKNTLGKDAFLQLLVTQLKNQNPLEPQDNGAFVAQLAQFSSLEGITTLNDTVSGIAGNYNSSQALQASSLVGRSVITPGDKAVVDTSKSMNGSVVVPGSVAGVTLKIADKDGKTVRTIDMGSQTAGDASFIWDGKDACGHHGASGTYTFTAPTHRSIAPRR